MTAFCEGRVLGPSPVGAGRAAGPTGTSQHHKLLSIVCVLCLLLTCSVAGVAQSIAGRLVGTVTDATGAVVAGAQVVATNEATGIQQTATTGQNGDYSIYPLAPGRYNVAAQSSGFSPVTLRGLVLDVNSTVSHNFVLEIGSTTSEVTVSADAVTLVPQTISVESVIDQEQLHSMPLNGRDFNQLVLLAPGATDNTAATGVNLDFGSYSLNGNRAFSNEYLVDGVPNNNPFQGKSATPLSVDAIAEFKVISGVPPAEFGHAATAITSITKSGSNKFHGSLFEYYRGDLLKASSPFNTMGEKENFLRNQFGGSLGGPVTIPHVIDGHGKTFFFFNYEGQRQSKTSPKVNTVPRPEFWTGDFSYLLTPEYCPTDPKKCVQLRDPLTKGKPIIPGNRLDLYQGGSLINSTALLLRSYYPDPNNGTGLVNNLIMFPDETENRDQFTARIDHSLPHSQMLTARLSYDNTGGFRPNVLGTPGVGLTEPQRSRNASLTWTAPITSTVVNELRFGAMNYSDIVTYVSGNAPTVESMGLKGFEAGNAGIPSIPRIGFSGTDFFTTIKDGYSEGYGEAALSMTSNIFTLADSIAFTKGTHAFKVGFEGRRDYFNVLQQTNARGQITFTGSASSANSTGYSFADLLVGLPSSTQQVPIKAKALLTENEYAGFAQDSWRIRQNLTLNLGVRYEFSPSPAEANNRLSMFSDLVPGGAFVVACKNGQLPTDRFLQSVIQKLTDANGNLTYPIVCGTDHGYNANNLVSTGTKNWAPRVGFVWDPTGKGVYSVRGGYGMVYSRYPVQYFLQTMLVNPPFAGLFPYSQKITFPAGAPNGTVGVQALTFDNPYGGTGKASVSPIGIDRNFILPNNQQWNLGVARSLGSNTMMSVSYVGNKGTHLFRTFNVNQRIVDSTTGQVVQKYSATPFGTSNLPMRRSDGNSIYNAMVVEVRRRASKTLNFQANWTWAKSIDDVSTNVQTSGLDILSPGRDRADSDYARRHTVSFNSSYKLPFGHGQLIGANMPGWVDAVAGGWSLSGIWHWSTGRFMTASAKSQGGLSNTRPDAVEGVSPNLPRDQRARGRWFNVDAFAPVSDVDPETGEILIPRFGTAGRNTIIGPGLNAVDMSLRKAFRLGEGRRLSLDISLFNAFNHPNWGNPDTNISNTNTVGTINDLSKDMRLAQFSVRFDF